MRKLVLAFSAMLVTIALKAQENYDEVTLNVKLSPIQTLVVNQNQKTVNLEYDSKEDYENGVSETKQDHLTVYSTGGYQVKVKSSGSQLIGTSKNLDASTVKIVASAGSNPANEAQYASSQSLSADDKVIVSSSTGGVDKNFNVTYVGAGADAYLNYYVAGQTPTVYTTSVTYTIVAQ
ncbi:hypothetical protein SAMN02927921_00762 [Sinomicrobium oceani]|uniref:Uncharacterized protein n=1 Tax=Sinomicrobium oceani TaxID=1150368 RepID=A0A1K1MR88_9FLAO|nr:hypothetical protein [Sinomicrobium oceani]SFW25708.1 hypothetical protein SAMN02927921_00762 [Sinomicrobium oceani]